MSKLTEVEINGRLFPIRSAARLALRYLNKRSLFASDTRGNKSLGFGSDYTPGFLPAQSETRSMC